MNILRLLTVLIWGGCECSGDKYPAAKEKLHEAKV
jgi:hypothetical protein